MPDRTLKARPSLLRELGASHAASIVIGVVIGSGIFLVPAEMMQAAGSAKLVYLAWIVGGVFSFFGAVTFAPLGVMKPQSGGEYVYLTHAYGPEWGFMTGWVSFFAGFSAPIATADCNSSATSARSTRYPAQ